MARRPPAQPCVLPPRHPRSGAGILAALAALAALLCYVPCFVPTKAAEVRPEAAALALLAAPEAAQARLPEEFVIFAPIVDVLPVLPRLGGQLLWLHKWNRIISPRSR